ncbi:LON peptidase N-terminal domain and RING finger protein 3-like [Leptidea sinapis]|uniref:RING-type domain-containing protein n=1 Tax=Leptidea sinapis TaxID=189913 RepID=A0A5E4PNY9_9NEOP|nr:LON peptidase N-terminal domain and RING finger protein 3-like [Leptidea sinapis]VVC87543.1 unnamed protein product [Leptidea sinapis]
MVEYHDNGAVIDLTDSFTLVNHYALSNSIIEVDDTDDSIIINVEENTSAVRKTTKQFGQGSNIEKNTTRTPEELPLKVGVCAICLEQLGKTQPGTTKCGHVFCLKCLEKALRRDKKCPHCRTVLKGANAYHKIFLPIGI